MTALAYQADPNCLSPHQPHLPHCHEDVEDYQVDTLYRTVQYSTVQYSPMKYKVSLGAFVVISLSAGQTNYE